MTRGRSTRRSDQKGIEAIFSSTKEPRRARLIFGGLALFAGISFITISIVMVQFPVLWDGSAAASYGSLGFASIGVFVLTCGVGIIISGFQLSHSPVSRAKLGENGAGHLPPIGGVVENASHLSSSRLPSLNVRLAVAVFFQGAILLSLYTGLVEEYQSNPTMQIWVRSSLDSAQYLLNWGALFVSSFLVGILVVYSLVTRDS